MILDVAGSPNDENELEEFRFQFVAATLVLRLTGFRRYVRSDETAPWQQVGEWTYPDLEHKSTLPQPEVPTWAVCDAKTLLSNKISFHE